MGEQNIFNSEINAIEELADQCLQMLIKLHESKQEKLEKFENEDSKAKQYHSVTNELEMFRTRLQLARKKVQHLRDVLKSQVVKPESLHDSIDDLRSSLEAIRSELQSKR